jgi:hypothetical protein
MQLIRTLNRLAAGAAVLAAAALTACSDVSSPDALLVQRDMSLDELGRHVTAPAWVDVTLRDGGVVAQRVAIKTGDELAGDERLTTDGDAATLTFGYSVSLTIDHETALAGAGGDPLTFEQFVGQVSEALAAGREPWLEASTTGRAAGAG